jgi:nitrogen PTS system EIIA component
MEIKDFLTSDCATIERRAWDKSRLLNELARRAAERLGLASEHIAAQLFKREALGSTGTGDAVAIPHARLDGISKPFGMLVRLEKALDFDAIDLRKVDLVFLLLLPTAAQSEPLNALAAVARALRDPDTARRLRSALDDAALYRAMTGQSHPR